MKDKVTIGTVFKIEGGNNGLVEEFVYNNQSNSDDEGLAVLSGATLESNFLGFVAKHSKINNKPLKIFSTPAILLTRKGLAGTMIYINTKKFVINDDAYVMTLKPEWKDKVNLRWFVYTYQELFKSFVTSKSANATFSKKYAINKEITLPDITIQDSITNQYKLLMDLKNKMEKSVMSLSKRFDVNMKVEGDPKLLDDVFHLTTGSDDNLTEKYIYENNGITPVYSGNTTNGGILGHINRKDYDPSDEYITWAILGKAGTMYLRNGPCCLTRHCGIMMPKQKEKINLDWFILMHQKKIQDFALAKEGIGQLKKIRIKRYSFVLPCMDFQNAVVKEYSKIIDLKKKFEKINLCIIDRLNVVVTT